MARCHLFAPRFREFGYGSLFSSIRRKILQRTQVEGIRTDLFGLETVFTWMETLTGLTVFSSVSVWRCGDHDNINVSSTTVVLVPKYLYVHEKSYSPMRIKITLNKV